ncbi:MAG: tRNA pseudouridine(38-40) synthase TruA [Armatimonadetes bacterium]|nr:tRNA pseudouridine(38-40) synthase TruA [Armatimonadota bacterium]
MRHLRLVVQYDGTDFAGFQVQPDSVTVQGTLEQALSKLLGETIRITAASRTDAGVHAGGQVIAFTTENVIPLQRLVGALNAQLPPAVVSISADEVGPDFHPRYAARRKLYRYRLLNRPLPSPFLGRTAWHVPEPLDVAAMQEAGARLVGEHDFAAFCAAGGAARTTVRELYEVAVERNGEIVEIDVLGSGFLYMMMRIIVGTLVEVGLGKLTPARVGEILAGRDRRQAGATAPAGGLTLVRVEY